MAEKYPDAVVLITPDSPLTPGLPGYVEAVHHALRVQSVEVPLDDLICASSAAFATYAYSPEINKHDEARRHSFLAEHFSNYGLFESLGYYTGAQLLIANEVSDSDFWEFVRFELNLGRPLVSAGCGRDDGCVLILGYEEQGRELLVWDSELRRVSVQDARPQGESEVFVNFAAAVRANPVLPDPQARQKMRVTALHWAVSHARKGTEFFHETRENYLVGLAGGAFVAELLSSELSDEERRWCESHLAARRRSRLAARALRDWEEDLCKTYEAPVGVLRRVSDLYEATAEALKEGRYAQALELEREAIEALTAYAKHLPSPLGLS